MTTRRREERPKYGALNHRRRRIGAAPRFGSAHLRLTEDVLDRMHLLLPGLRLRPRRHGDRQPVRSKRLTADFDAREPHR